MIGKSMNNIEAAGSYPRPKAGGYVIQITEVSNDKTRERLEIEFDFYEGEFKGYYSEQKARLGYTIGKFTKSYKDNALPFFRAFLEAVVASNEDTSNLIVGDYDDVDETQLPGKLVGMVVGERRYIGIDGQEKQNIDIYKATFIAVDDIRAGNFTVPELRLADELQGRPAPEVVDMSAPMDSFTPDPSDPPF